MWANMGVAETSIILWKMCTPESNKKIYIEQKKRKAIWCWLKLSQKCCIKYTKKYTNKISPYSEILCDSIPCNQIFQKKLYKCPIEIVLYMWKNSVNKLSTLPNDPVRVYCSCYLTFFSGTPIVPPLTGKPNPCRGNGHVNVDPVAGILNDQCPPHRLHDLLPTYVTAVPLMISTGECHSLDVFVSSLLRLWSILPKMLCPSL